MSIANSLSELLNRLRILRKQAGISTTELEEALILGPGWVSRFESGESIPSLDVLLSMLFRIGYGLPDLIKDIEIKEVPEIKRQIYAEPKKNNLIINFPYGNFNAQYTLKNARLTEFDTILKELRDGLSLLVLPNTIDIEAIKTDAVAKTFLKAIHIWPHANPSDIWWFLIYRAYCDPFNHPAPYARLDFNQSWKRTGGWALEEVLVRHYGPFLREKDINIFIASAECKSQFLNQLDITERLEAAKVDILLTGLFNEKEILFGVVHVKSSFAERRTDDVPMSRALIKAGYTSPLWTLDCKSTPSNNPYNKGELGIIISEVDDKRSAKRKDIEDDGYFSACFSYNKNTKPTPDTQNSRAKIICCDFSNPNDKFSQFIISEWYRFQKMIT